MTDAQISLRALSDPADLEQLQPLYEQSDGPSYDFFKGLLDQPHCKAWCLLKDKQPVAAIWYQCATEQADMIDLRVLASERRQGFGRQLLWASLTALGDVSAVALEVRSSNAAARALYQSLGFSETGARRNYYATPDGREDAVLMTLTLNIGGSVT
ncbi:MAG: GNAT family N-acetyltransferase [Luminiphilus sp.]|nr:GNAT family N-acetyltransferase [Luminiphilus sp.]